MSSVPPRDPNEHRADETPPRRIGPRPPTAGALPTPRSSWIPRPDPSACQYRDRPRATLMGADGRPVCDLHQRMERHVRGDWPDAASPPYCFWCGRDLGRLHQTAWARRVFHDFDCLDTEGTHHIPRPQWEAGFRWPPQVGAPRHAGDPAVMETERQGADEPRLAAPRDDAGAVWGDAEDRPADQDEASTEDKDDLPKLPSRGADLRVWQATWREIHDLVDKGTKPHQIKQHIENNVNTEDRVAHLPSDLRTIAKITSAGLAGLLE